nr:immunoglobulin heavy chain junction region [Mus musculus]MBK4184371.1 immunoglobulin heavy chain junction region [Mus musculus]
CARNYYGSSPDFW